MQNQLNDRSTNPTPWHPELIAESAKHGSLYCVMRGTEVLKRRGYPRKFTTFANASVAADAANSTR